MTSTEIKVVWLQSNTICIISQIPLTRKKLVVQACRRVGKPTLQPPEPRDERGPDFNYFDNGDAGVLPYCVMIPIVLRARFEWRSGVHGGTVATEKGSIGVGREKKLLSSWALLVDKLILKGVGVFLFGFVGGKGCPFGPTIKKEPWKYTHSTLALQQNI